MRDGFLLCQLVLAWRRSVSGRARAEAHSGLAGRGQRVGRGHGGHRALRTNIYGHEFIFNF